MAWVALNQNETSRYSRHLIMPEVGMQEQLKLKAGRVLALQDPGATLVPLGQLTSRLGELNRDADMVVICRSGARSGGRLNI